MQRQIPQGRLPQGSESGFGLRQRHERTNGHCEVPERQEEGQKESRPTRADLLPPPEQPERA